MKVIPHHSLMAASALLAVTACHKPTPTPVIRNLQQEFIIVVPQTTTTTERIPAARQP